MLTIVATAMRRSVIPPGVLIHTTTLVKRCVLMDSVEIGRGAMIRNVNLRAAARIGLDRETEANRLQVSPKGIAAIAKGTGAALE